MQANELPWITLPLKTQTKPMAKSNQDHNQMKLAGTLSH